MATLSILALYHFDDKIFDGLELPAGMDRGALTSEILLECAELEIVYPDWDIMHEAIRYWSRTMIDRWTRAWEALQAEYNPLWNVDATIRETETRDLASTDKRSGAGSEDVNRSGSSTRADTERTQGDSTLKVSGFNEGSSGDWADREKTVVDNTVTDNGQTSEREATQRGYKDREDRAGTDTGTISRETERHGNIGVTSSQQLLREEYELAELNLYHMIVKQFKRRFCLLVY